jgi:DNA modification methylase
MLENKIICGDSVTVLKKISDESIDCIITSPPYDDLREYDKDSKEMYTFTFDSFKKIATELARVLRKGGVIVWVVGDEVKKGSESGSSFRQALYFKDELHLNIHDTMIYKKNSSAFPARPGGNRYSQIFEYMFIFSKGSPSVAHLLCDKPNAWKGWIGFGKVTQRGRNGELVPSKREENNKAVPEKSARNNIWKYATGKNYSSSDSLASGHPAIFPEGLVGDHLLTWTNENDIVLDPFNGSGTTTKMAYLLKRRYIGIDISQKYCDIALARLAEVQEVNRTAFNSDIDFGEDIDLTNPTKNWKK